MTGVTQIIFLYGTNIIRQDEVSTVRYSTLFAYVSQFFFSTQKESLQTTCILFIGKASLDPFSTELPNVISLEKNAITKLLVLRDNFPLICLDDFSQC